MRYRNIIIGIGFFIILVNFSGLPRDWKDALFILSGLLVITGGYLSEKDRTTRQNKPVTSAAAPTTPTQTISNNTQS